MVLLTARMPLLTATSALRLRRRRGVLLNSVIYTVSVPSHYLQIRIPNINSQQHLVETTCSPSVRLLLLLLIFDVNCRLSARLSSGISTPRSSLGSHESPPSGFSICSAAFVGLTGTDRQSTGLATSVAIGRVYTRCKLILHPEENCRRLTIEDRPTLLTMLLVVTLV